MNARFTHPIERAQERYGISLTPADIERLEDDVREGRACLVRSVKSRSSPYKLWLVQLLPVLVALAIVSAVSGHIVTFLPRNAANRSTTVKRTSGRGRR